MPRSLTIKIIALIVSAGIGVMITGLITVAVGRFIVAVGFGGIDMWSTEVVKLIPFVLFPKFDELFWELFLGGISYGLSSMILVFFVLLARIVWEWYQGKNKRINLFVYTIFVAAIAAAIIGTSFVMRFIPVNPISATIFLLVVLKCQPIAERFLTTYFPE